MRDYELVVIVDPDVGDEGFPTTVERITNFIKDRGAEIKNVDHWGRRRLAYPIRRNLDGYYAVTHFSAEPTAIRPLEANLDLAEDILRHLVVKIDEETLAFAGRVPAAATVEDGDGETEAPDVEASGEDALATVADEVETPDEAPEAVVEEAPAAEEAPASEPDEAAAGEPEGN